MSGLKNKVVLITGASSGIGAGTAIHLASLGCSVAINGRNVENLQKTAQDCVRAGLPRDSVLLVPGDLNVDGVAEQIIKKTVDHFGKLDVLINNAGIVKLCRALVTDILDYEAIMNTNVKSAFKVSQAAVPHLKKTKGNIINVSSAASIQCSIDLGVYSVSKAALDHLTRAMAQELGDFGIRVNCINPGFVETDIFITSGMDEEANNILAKEIVPTKHILGRSGKIDEIAKPIAFLASDDASFITGSCMVVDGGHSIKGP